MVAGKLIRLPRQDNRRRLLLDCAARLFAEGGYHATSMRDIAKAAGMLSGSIYYHFASKEEMLAAVYEDGVRRIAERVDSAVARERDPRRRLAAACVAHLEAILDQGDYAQVVIRVLPRDAAAIAPRLIALRNRYEDRFRRLVDALGLPSRGDRRHLRLMLIGALNWSQVWYHANGDLPETIARKFLRLLFQRLPAKRG